MLDTLALNASWDALLDLFASRFDKAPVSHGPNTSKALRKTKGQYPTWARHPTDLDTSTTLAAMGPDPLVPVLKHLHPVLDWRTRGVFTDSEHTNRGYVEFVGPEGMVENHDVRLGIYWHDAHTFYPSHRHNAVELYHPISGTGLWQHKTEDWVPRPAGGFILHESRDNHATKTEDQPILALWSWLGDLSFDSYSMDEAPENLGQNFLDFRR